MSRHTRLPFSYAAVLSTASTTSSTTSSTTAAVKVICTDETSIEPSTQVPTQHGILLGIVCGPLCSQTSVQPYVLPLLLTTTTIATSVTATTCDDRNEGSIHAATPIHLVVLIEIPCEYPYLQPSVLTPRLGVDFAGFGCLCNLGCALGDPVVGLSRGGVVVYRTF